MEITLKFNEPLNISLQVGDTIWYTTPASVGGYDTAAKDTINKLGNVEFISNQYQAYEIKVSHPHDPNDPSVIAPVITTSSFIMFSKNNKVNLGKVKGYYAEVNLKNNSTEKAELFAVSSEIVQSSK
mgnify:CR=1 FL=1